MALFVSASRGNGRSTDTSDRDPRVALCIASPTPPYVEVVLEGEASITEEGGPELIERLCLRYYGEVEGRRYCRLHECPRRAALSFIFADTCPHMGLCQPRTTTTVLGAMTFPGLGT